MGGMLLQYLTADLAELQACKVQPKEEQKVERRA